MDLMGTVMVGFIAMRLGSFLVVATICIYLLYYPHGSDMAQPQGLLCVFFCVACCVEKDMQQDATVKISKHLEEEQPCCEKTFGGVFSFLFYQDVAIPEDPKRRLKRNIKKRLDGLECECEKDSWLIIWPGMEPCDPYVQ